MITDITGVLIADHKEQINGTEKSLLEIEGIPLIKKTYGILKSIFENNILVTADPENYEFVDAIKVKKGFIGLEPLSDIYSSLKYITSDKVFVVSSNLPFLQRSVIEFLLSVKTDGPVVLPRVGKDIEYSCGIYDTGILPIIENILIAAADSILNHKPVKNSALSLWNFIDRIDAKIVDIEYEMFYFKDLFFQIESEKDLEYVRENII